MHRISDSLLSDEHSDTIIDPQAPLILVQYFVSQSGAGSV